MRSDVPPKSVSGIIPFKSSFLKEGICNAGSCQISKDGQLAWIVKGSTLEVYSLKTVELKSSWKFNMEPKDPAVIIGKVAEFSQSTGSLCPQLLITLDGLNMLCLYDITCSKILKAVKLPGKICSIEVIANEGGPCIQNRPLAHELRYAFGLVAASLEGGLVVLVDLVLDEDWYFNWETCSGEACVLSLQAPNLGLMREKALTERQHLVFTLNDESFHQGNFVFFGAETKVISVIRSEKVVVTAMFYIPHLAILALGFNFGGFQLWNMHKLLIEYAFPVQIRMEPVVYFAFQEPENDPRNYCYLWVVRGQTGSEKINSDMVSTASLFSLGYRQKQWMEGYGFLYQEMTSCSHRFDYHLTTDPLRLLEFPGGGSRIVTFRCIQQAEALGFPRIDSDDLQNEDLNAQDLSLCVMVWEAWSSKENSVYILGIFDLNQWYQAQMPAQIRRTKSNHCSYMGIFSLSEVQQAIKGTNLLDFHVNMSSITKYKLLSGRDEMYFPSSLAFGAKCLAIGGIIKLAYLGRQQQLLWEMENLGPSCLSNPDAIYELCTDAGLLSYSSSVSSSISLKREALLTLLLDHHNLNFITACVMQWSTSENPKTNCTTKFLLTWLWKRICHIKNTCDKICVPLFNCSGRDLDQTSITLLQRYATQLELISTMLKAMQNHPSPISKLGSQELSIRLEVTQLLFTYLKAILWLRYCSLLPEHAEGEAYGENEVAYPASLLTEAYDQRRKELQQIHSAVRQSDLLMIDGMINQLNDTASCYSEKTSTMHNYPPQSLHSLLTTYLLKGPSLQDKHCLVLYLLLDMAAFLSKRQSHLEEKLMQFPACFQISHSRVKLTQGFWMLDHRDFEEAIDFFTDPVVNFADIQQWQHIRIIKSFLYQGEHQKALHYIHVCKPQMRSPEEVKLQLSVLLANKLVTHAIEYQRQYSDDRNSEDLLMHFFTGCQQTGSMESMLKLSFSPMEEESLLKFLYDSSESMNKDILVMHLLQQGKILEASRINENLMPTIMDNTNRTKTRTSKRNTLVMAYLNTLPPVQINLAKEIERHKTILNSRKDLSRPTPLSTTIRFNCGKIVSQSSRLQELMNKVKDTWSYSPACEQSPLITKTADLIDFSKREHVPFVNYLSSRYKDRKRESEIVCATPVGKRSFSFLDGYDSAKIPQKRSRISDYGYSVKADIDRSRGIRPISADVMALLQTPPVQRNIPIMKHNLLESVERTGTPQSILKIKSSVQRALSPTFSKGTLSCIRPHENVSNLKARLERNDMDINASLERNEMDINASLERNEMDINASIDATVEKSLSFAITGSSTLEETSKSSIVDSDWSNCLEMDPKRDDLPSQDLEQAFVQSHQNWNKAERSFTGYNSDNIVVEDDEITVNLTIQKRREIKTVKTQTTDIGKLANTEIPETRKRVTDEFDTEIECIKSINLEVSETQNTIIDKFAIEAIPEDFEGIMKENAKLITVNETVAIDDELYHSCSSKASFSSCVPENTSLDIINSKSLTSSETPQTPPNILSSSALEAVDSCTKAYSDYITKASSHWLQLSSSSSDTSEPSTELSNPDVLSPEQSSRLLTVSKTLFNKSTEVQPSPINRATLKTALECVSKNVSVTEEIPFYATNLLGCQDRATDSYITTNEMDALEINGNVPKIDRPIDQHVLSYALEQVSQAISATQNMQASIKSPEYFVFQKPRVACKNTEIMNREHPETGDAEKVRSFIFNLPNFPKVMEPKPQENPITCNKNLQQMVVEKPWANLKLDVLSFPKSAQSFSSPTLHCSEDDQDEGIDVASENQPSIRTRLNFNTLSSEENIGNSFTKQKMRKPENFTLNSCSSEIVESEIDTLQDLLLTNRDAYIHGETDKANNLSNSPSSIIKGIQTSLSCSQKDDDDGDCSDLLDKDRSAISECSETSLNELKFAAMKTRVLLDTSETTASENSDQISPASSWSARLRPRSRSNSVLSNESSPGKEESGKVTKTEEPLGVRPKTKSRSKRKTTSAKHEVEYIFSPPTIPEEDLEHLDEDLDKTPKALPFVFSPPSTRSKLRRKKSMDVERPKDDVLDSQMTRKPITRSNLAGPTPPWETFINVISPGPEIFPNQQAQMRMSRGTAGNLRTTLTRHSTRLKAGSAKNRKKVKL